MNDELYHHGVKGMKWGVRKKKDQNNINKRKSKKQSVRQEIEQIVKDKKNSGRKWKTSAGYDISLEPEVTPKTAQFLARYSRTIRNNIKDSSTFTISSKGKKIGDLQLYDNRKDNSVNVAWIGIDQSSRGKGYAQSVMNNVVKNAEKNGKSKVTLEVPGRSPDARHIYEKIGFKPTGEVLGEKGDYWDGLTVMELDLEERRRMKHSDTGSLTNELYHHGVKGMKWGIRKKRTSTTKSSGKSKTSKTKSNKKKTKKKINKKAVFDLVDAMADLGYTAVASNKMNKYKDSEDFVERALYNNRHEIAGNLYTQEKNRYKREYDEKYGWIDYV